MLERSVLEVDRWVREGGETILLYGPGWPIYILKGAASQGIKNLDLWHGTCIHPLQSIIPSFLTEKGNGMRTDNKGRDGRDWKQLCAAASREPDSEKLVSLVQQILQAFNEQDEKKNPAAGDIRSALL
jgi:hypothetical protein